MAKISGLKRLAFAAAVAGAVLSDIDILFFYFVDGRAIHHHRYWVHVPLFWAIVAGTTLPILWKSRFKSVGFAFFAAIYMHLILDSISGGIMWLAPLNTDLWALFTVTPSHSHWILSFLLHWTVLFEALIWATAIYLYAKGRRHSSAG
ncbi:MAG: metal-dependent hydrolase [Litoreibacter sp.]